MWREHLVKNNGSNKTSLERVFHRSYVNLASYGLLTAENSSHLTEVYFDGVACVWLYNLFTRTNIKRRSFDFTSDAREVFEICCAKGMKVCVIGGTRQESRVFSEKLAEAGLALDHWDFFSGYLSESDTATWEDFVSLNVVDRYDLVLLGLGAPLQEQVGKIISQLSKTTSTITCGAFISQTAVGRRLAYYPPLVSALNLRWLYRAIREPHVLPRLVKEYPRNGLAFCKDVMWLRKEL